MTNQYYSKWDLLLQNVMKIPKNLTLKIIENAMRIFEAKITIPQMKALKTVVRWIFRNTTLIISHLHEHEEMETKKFIEKHSHHLGNMDIVDTIQEKAIRIIKKAINKDIEKPTFLSYDESDIFKPDAKKMPWLSRVRDWSTGLCGNGYVFRWMNVNGISLFSELDEITEQNEIYEKKTKWDKAIDMFEKTRNTIPEIVWRGNSYFLYDRAWDDIEIIDNLIENNNKFVIRMKKVRNLIEIKTWLKKKINEFGIWKHYVAIEVWTCVYLHIIKKKTERDPILLVTNDETLDSKTVLEYYLKRRKIEEDFNKMKDLWLEKVRLMSTHKIKNLIAIIQFIIVLSQDVFNEVMQKSDMTNEYIYLYFAKFCKRKSLTLNPQSFIKFISEWLVLYRNYDMNMEVVDTLFWGRRDLKKLGII